MPITSAPQVRTCIHGYGITRVWRSWLLSERFHRPNYNFRGGFVHSRRGSHSFHSPPRQCLLSAQSDRHPFRICDSTRRHRISSARATNRSGIDTFSLCSPGRGRHDNERKRGKFRQRRRENLSCRIVTWVLEEEFMTTRASQCEFPRGVCRVGVRVSSSCFVLRVVHASHASFFKYAHASSRVHAFHVCACICVRLCVFTRAKYDIIYPLDCRHNGLVQFRVYVAEQKSLEWQEDDSGKRKRGSALGRFRIPSRRFISAPGVTAFSDSLLWHINHATYFIGDVEI